MADNDVALRLVNLTKQFGDVTAVDDICLDIFRCEFLTLLGPSGCGKSTTLHLIAGFEQPTRGQIFLDNRPLAGIPAYKRQIGVVFQNYALFPHLTTKENIAFALRNLRWSAKQIDERVKELLALVRLEGMGNRYSSQLSGGQQQRIALARALSFKPSLLLLDEPLGALDKKMRQYMLEEFRRIHQILKTTMVFVTHDQEEALVMSTRVAVMNEGRIIRVGTPRELYEDPRHPFVADFLGESNILSGIAVENNSVNCGGRNLCVSHNFPEGAEIKILVRPEKMAIGKGGAGVNQVSGIVEEVLYLGESSKYWVKTPDGSRFLVKQTNQHITDIHDIGDNVTVYWLPEDTRILAG